LTIKESILSLNFLLKLSNKAEITELFSIVNRVFLISIESSKAIKVVLAQQRQVLLMQHRLEQVMKKKISGVNQ
jgi:hypothetical protein